MKRLFAELKRRNVIRVAMFYGAGAWLILQVADVLLEIVDAPDGSLRLIAIILALGFPFALILAWAFEITPEGIKREHEVDRSATADARTGRKLDIATIGLLGLAIVLLLWQGLGGRVPDPDPGPVAQRSAEPPADGPRSLSIAVLPFVNMSVDPENEYFSDGLAEEVLNLLARMADFRVAGRTSSFAFKGQQQDLRAIGERLGVANILEGSVRKQGDRVRVTAQLVDAGSGYHLWSDTYDRRLDDVFAIQDDIATEVVRALRVTLLAADEAVIQQSPKGDVDAYNHYLRGLYHTRLRTRAGLDRALEEFQQAIVIDPEYAPPYAGVAMVYALLDNYGYRALTETGALANRALDRALALDPRSDDAWAVRGLLLGQGPGANERRDEARAALDKAVEINPNSAVAHFWRTNTLFPDFEAARASLERAYDLDPLSPVIVFRRVMNAMQAGDQEGLARFMAELHEVAPDWFMTWGAISSVAQEEGRVADAALALERSIELNPDYPSAVSQLAQALDTLGYSQRALRVAEAAQVRFGDPGSRITIGYIQARRALITNGFDAALEIYRDAVERSGEAGEERQADLAMLEIGAGDLAAALARLRQRLGLGPDELPGEFSMRHMADYFVDHLVLVAALAELGDREAATNLADSMRRQLAEMRERGIDFNYMPIAEAYLDYRVGRDVSMEAAMEAALRKGFRGPPENFAWIMSTPPDDPMVQRLMAMMAEALAPERARYAELSGRAPESD